MTLHAMAAMACSPTAALVEQSADGVDDRGEGLVLGELTQPVGHCLGPHEPAAEEHKEDQDHRGVAGGLDALGGQAECDSQPDIQRGR